MTAWHIEGIAPKELVALLKSLGLSACSLAFSYHGGRMLLPSNGLHTVYEQHLSAVYFPIDAQRYHGLRLQPTVAQQAALIPPLLEACQAEGFEVNAWTVLCHNDRLGLQNPDCCMENVFGGRCSYTLCPSNPDVQQYLSALCADIASTPGIARLDLEALGFMGYEHGGLHDKSSVPLTEWVKWLLSICVCRSCRQGMESVAEEFIHKARAHLRRYFEEFEPKREETALREQLAAMLGGELLEAVIEMRQRVAQDLLSAIRAVTRAQHLNLRLVTNPLFCGGKTFLSWCDLQGRVDSVTVTFLGKSERQMASELAAIPHPNSAPYPFMPALCFIIRIALQKTICADGLPCSEMRRWTVSPFIASVWQGPLI